MKVLLVEDRPSDGELVRMALSRSRVLRFEITRTTEIDEAIRCARHAPFDVLLYDLAVADRLGVMQVIASCPGLPVVVLSDRGDEEIERAILDEGAHDFVNKAGLSDRNLATVIERAIGRRKLEQEHARLESRLASAQRLESLGRISNDIAHELNDLLVTILGNAELVKLDLPRETGLGVFVDEIEAAGQSAASLIRRLGACAGRPHFDFEIAHVSSLISDMARALRGAARGSPTVIYEPGSELQRGAWIYADIRKMREAILDLLVQVVESTTDDLVTIQTRLEWVSNASLRASANEDELPEGHYVVIEIRSSRVMVTRPATGRIVDATHARTGGDGDLGLATILGILRGHRGTLRADVGPCSESTIQILLPCASAMRPQLLEGAPVRRATPTRGAPRSSPLAGRNALSPEKRDTILVVDREPDGRRAIAAMLLRAGYRVCAASSPRRALALLRQRGDEIRAVVLDLSLEEIARSGTFSGIRGIDPEVPVVFCSSGSEPQIEEFLAELDHVALAHKPFEREELSRKLDEICGDLEGGIRDVGQP